MVRNCGLRALYQLFYLHLVGSIRLILNLNNSIVMKTIYMLWLLFIMQVECR